MIGQLQHDAQISARSYTWEYIDVKHIKHTPEIEQCPYSRTQWDGKALTHAVKPSMLYVWWKNISPLKSAILRFLNYLDIFLNDEPNTPPVPISPYAQRLPLQRANVGRAAVRTSAAGGALAHQGNAFYPGGVVGQFWFSHSSLRVSLFS
jgi:hypothetical protein